MQVDIQIYLKSLKDYFYKNPDSKEQILSKFPDVEFENFMVEVERLAIHNYDLTGDPTISKKQILDILQILHTQTMKDGLQELVDDGSLDVQKDPQGIPQVRLTPEFKKELGHLKIFQLSTVGPICLN